MNDTLQPILEVLSTPYDFSDPASWQSEVLATFKKALGADSSALFMPHNGVATGYSNELPLTLLNEYESQADTLPSIDEVVLRAVNLAVHTRRELFGPHYAEYSSSSYCHDYVRKLRAFRGLGLTVDVGPRPSLSTIAQLFLYKSSEQASPFGERERQLLSTVYPSFRSAVFSALLRSEWNSSFGWTNEAECIVGFDFHGTCLFQNSAYDRLQQAETITGCQRLADAVFEVALEVSQTLVWPGRVGIRHLETHLSEYRLSVSLSRNSPNADNRAFLVHVVPMSFGWPKVFESRTEFDLTRQEARVCQLLARRYTNTEIADALFISPKTARNHTEQVLVKMGVSNRTEIRARVIERFGPRFGQTQETGRQHAF